MPQADQMSTTGSGGAAEAGRAKAAEVTGQAQEKAQQAAGQAQEKAQQAAGQAQEKAQQAAVQVQDRLREQIDQRSSQAADLINEQGSDLRSVGESLRREGKDGPAKAADRLAEYAEKVGDYLSEKDSHAILADAEDFARRQPWAVAAGGLALGFTASRFLKASSSERFQSHPSHPSRPRGAPALTRGSLERDDPAPFAGPGSLVPGAAPGVL